MCYFLVVPIRKKAFFLIADAISQLGSDNPNKFLRISTNLNTTFYQNFVKQLPRSPFLDRAKILVARI
jgi:hypothetical protein